MGISSEHFCDFSEVVNILSHKLVLKYSYEKKLEYVTTWPNKQRLEL